MPKPDHQVRMEITVELPGTPEQVWAAIATAGGISSWFLPTDLEEREGGRIVTHMGETSSEGSVTGWDPPRRFAYEEPDWPALAGHPEATDVSPLATEFLIEARSGGTCVLRVVSSAFGTGADWEQEFVDEMAAGWAPFFDRLRLYLLHFDGHVATPWETDVQVPGDDRDAVLAAIRADLGAERLGQTVDANGTKGEVVQIVPEGFLVLAADPAPGFLALASWPTGEGSVVARVQLQLFGPDAPAAVATLGPRWRSWLESLDLKSA